MGRLEGKVCVVTGAAGGIGAETVARFAAEGAQVVGVDLAENAPGDLSLQVDAGDRGALVHEQPRALGADAARRAGDDADLAVEPGHASPPSRSRRT